MSKTLDQATKIKRFVQETPAKRNTTDLQPKRQQRNHLHPGLHAPSQD